MRRTQFTLLVLVVIPAAGSAQAPIQSRDQVVAAIEAKRAQYTGVAQRIWGFAEVGYQEVKSSALLQEQLTGAGFTVQSSVAEIPTAFVRATGAASRLSPSSESSTRFPACRRTRCPPGRSWSRGDLGMAAGIISSAPLRRRPPSRSRIGWPPTGGAVRCGSTGRRRKREVAARST